ncbi:MAG: hypothetical protein RIB46_16095 [Pseudomonadales bacterium]
MKIKLLTLEDAQNDNVTEMLDALNKKRQQAVDQGDEALANDCWREIEALELNLLFVEAFHKLGEHQYREAWHDLERCEIKCESLKRNTSDQYFERSRARFIQQMVTRWQSLYPYCIFVSPAMTVGYYECSICGHKIRPRSRCTHQKGRVYLGELCVHVARDVQLGEISLVTNPVQKYSVLHNDETLDFSLISHLREMLDHPFEPWDLNWTTKKFPRERFSAVTGDAACPCKSGKAFGDCCIDQPEVEIPHVDFLLSKQVTVKEQFPN